MNINNGRQWSNIELKKIAKSLPEFRNAINVSGYLDEDKAGGSYKSYFNAQNYEISSYAEDDCYTNPKSNLFINLDADSSQLPKSCRAKYDLVFSHTVLEHVKNPFNAFKNFKILLAPNGILITVVPFIYKFHFSKGNYGDYWRFTPHGMEILHQSVNLEIKEINIGPENSFEKYLITVGTTKSNNLDYKRFDYEFLNEKLGAIGYLDLLKNSRTKILNSIKARL
jgi:SAM-dependent methyltransferase